MWVVGGGVFVGGWMDGMLVTDKGEKVLTGFDEWVCYLDGVYVLRVGHSGRIWLDLVAQRIR